MTIRQAFAEAHRAARLIWAGHPIAALAAHNKLSDEALAVYGQALKCANHGPYISGATAARRAAKKYGYSYRWALRSNLRAVLGRKERRSLGLPTGIYSIRPLP